MSSGQRKRKREELEDSDEEEISFGRQILPVANLPGNYDGIPQDGMEYLFTVRRDALRLPHVTRVKNPYADTEAKLIPPPPRHSSPHPSLPSDEWRTLIENRFQNLRKNLMQPTIHVDIPQHSTKIMPNIQERTLWWEFLAGKPDTEWNPPKKVKNTKQRKFGKGMRAFTPTEGDPEGVSTAAIAQRASEGQPSEVSPGPYKHKQPIPRILKLLDERMSLHLLMYFTHWINVYLQGRTSEPPSPPLRQAHAQWIFALLTRVGEFISADDMNLLRNLSRACFSLLKALVTEARQPEIDDGSSSKTSTDGDSEMDQTSCWMIIAIVVGIWKQRDLWMDAEDMLRGINVE
ncbi:hypothetical protein V5O48_016828 [Marasmius crinis-equi]|uniref:Gem-associated protein 2 n=1 Tax=Marasmius crinis-equi TaxID=585013 RepID=A0ABR3EQN2_9AGAR